MSRLRDVALGRDTRMTKPYRKATGPEVIAALVTVALYLAAYAYLVYFLYRVAVTVNAWPFG